ncbi:ATP-binding protein [Desulfonatronovibrio magnus]|uniref:ATP-binding protein n=1 Tax=Desulfonatronovibrio magnus TaxID=698827 RepID=UPI0005EB9D4D|nr:ATP-binding protein [Desulfonatronovibrio magnus]
MTIDCKITKTSLSCEFPADPTLVESLMEKVKLFLDAACDEKTFFNLTIVLRESLNNAIFHGADQDHSKIISCRALLTKDKVEFEVSGPGPGFDWRDSLKRNPAGSTSHCGWGLFLIRQYSDGFEYNDSGTVLRFWIMLNPRRSEHTVKLNDCS